MNLRKKALKFNFWINRIVICTISIVNVLDLFLFKIAYISKVFKLHHIRSVWHLYNEMNTQRHLQFFNTITTISQQHCIGMQKLRLGTPTRNQRTETISMLSLICLEEKMNMHIQFTHTHLHFSS
jgi:hypothetical protein